jgi:hypothetical protein
MYSHVGIPHTARPNGAPHRRNFSFLHVGKIISAAELPSLCYTILGLCGDGVRFESSCVWRGSALCSLPCQLFRASDSIKHGTSICVHLAFAQLGRPDRVSGPGKTRARQQRPVSCTHQKSGHCQLLHYVSVGILCHSLGG